MNNLKDILRRDAERTNAALDAATLNCDADYANLGEAIRYSLLDAGKRLRAYLVIEFCRAFGGDENAAMPYACAIEMVHAFSLIHDDLPCMDDDDMRRGKPSCHIKFGYDTALLAGDALLAMAFSVMTEAKLPSDNVVRAVALLSKASGRDGMVGGQVLDMIGENCHYLTDKLEKTQLLKTGALIRCAAELGILAANGDENAVKAAQDYADCIALAFQITDDILDAEGNAELLGKPIGSDAVNEKSTFYSVLGSDGCRKKVKELTERAKSALAPYEKCDRLCELADALMLRDF